MRNVDLLFLRLKKALWIRPASPMQRRALRLKTARVLPSAIPIPIPIPVTASPAIVSERRRVGL